MGNLTLVYCPRDKWGDLKNELLFSLIIFAASISLQP